MERTRVDRDLETRQRLIETAARLFAERGFSKVTVREICTAARANVAAINYHFGGKRGLYDEIVRSAIRTMQETTDEIRKASENRSADEQLAVYISIFLKRVVRARDGWIHHLMAQELSNPTPALDLVMKHVVKPRLALLAEIIGRVMAAPPTDQRVEHCVMSVQAQCIALLNNKIAKRFHPFELTPKRLDALADHITQFSLAGARAVKR